MSGEFDDDCDECDLWDKCRDQYDLINGIINKYKKSI